MYVYFFIYRPCDYSSNSAVLPRLFLFFLLLPVLFLSLFLLLCAILLLFGLCPTNVSKVSSGVISCSKRTQISQKSALESFRVVN